MALKATGKVIAAACSLALALTATVPFMSNAPAVKAAAAKTENGGYLYDFRDGSVIPTNTDGKSDVKLDTLTVKVGTQNAYQYNGAQHGVAFKAGNSLEIAVDGPTKLTVGDCQYSNATSVTVKSADGSYTETLNTKSGCYHNGGAAMVFKYPGTAATTLTVEFNNTTYVPVVMVDSLIETPDNNGVKKDSVYMYNFADNSVVPMSNDSANPVASTLTSKDGILTINSNNNFYWHDNQHGVAMFNGNSFEIKVAGDATVQFNLCQYGADKDATIVASSPKGEFVGATSQPLMVDETDGLSTVAFEYKGVATTLKFTVKAAEGELYLHGINVNNKPEATDPPKAPGNGKADVWDFGAEKLDETQYNNMLTADIINGFYESGKYAAGASGATIGSFGTDEIFFNAGGKTNNRIRTTNTAITRYDDKTKIIEDVTYSGFAYSNSSSPVVYMGVKLYENDILTVYGASNGNPSTVYCESPSGQIQVGETTGSGTKMTFYASEYGIYKLYSVNEKLVVCRMVREHTNPTEVSGTVDISAAAGIASKDYKIRFTNKSTGESTDASVANGTYKTYLNDGYTYDISLVNANGFIIKDNVPFELKKGTGTVAISAKNLAIESVNLVTITGKITGLSADALKALKLSFVNKDHAYVPEFTVSGDNITMQLENGVAYDIVAENVNDYALSNGTTISKTANGTQDIAFAAKPTYNINVTYNGLPDSAKSSAVLTFTNIDEDGYSYTFKAGETPKLRDGRYTVKVSGTGSAPYIQKLTSNVNVKGAAVNKTISFEPIEVWDFSKYNAGNPGIETIGDKPYYLGLELTPGNVMENKTYLLVNSGGEVKFDAKKGQIITLEYCYQAAFDINGDQVFSASGSTSKFESVSFIAPDDTPIIIKGIEGTTEDGKSAKQTYFTKISVVTPVPYKSQVTVGTNKEYKTINAALAAVAKMSRPNNERVKIVIDPGNYEEMLTINIPNVSLVNAAGKNSSLSIINKGVDIGENVVRITSYYGHGYDYFSMGSDVKSSDEVLAVNKENGYISTKNPGSGTTNGSYWNSTVVVYADGFEADGIVFENSFNQYISKKEAADTVVMWESGSKGQRPTTYGDTSVQTRSFVERAGALAIVGDKGVFTNCKFIGRQDTLYGGQNIQVLFEKCDILGAVDYIYGGMNAVFYQCQLRMNTDSNTASDQAYLTAAQQSSGRGYLMYNCTVTSTTPGVDTASEYRSKPGYLGRPWMANTSEVVFLNTVVETTDHPGSEGQSLIVPQGWNNTLGGESTKMYEYGTVEKSGENNAASRAGWSQVLDKPVIDDGKTGVTIKAFLGDWTSELNARGLALELDADGKPIDANPTTGIPGTAAAIAVAALAGTALFLARRKK